MLLLENTSLIVYCLHFHLHALASALIIDFYDFFYLLLDYIFSSREPQGRNLFGTLTGICTITFLVELQRRSLKILEERIVKSLLQVRNLYHLSTASGLEPVSIVY